MSLDNRNTSAQFKRAEQLKRWEESDMAKQASGIPKSPSLRRIQFTPGCIFLAACDAGDKDEVEYLLQDGADIDTANVDGLTALHQACIDDNLDMVEFLVQKGADVNRKDNEGWTPLHATASCGFLSIARYLIENGADLAAINSDGELPVDLANSDAMEDLIHHHNEQQGIDCDEARQAEERIMLSDATKWLRTDSSDCDKPDPKTGATAMHVAAAKGYNRVLKLLLEGRGDIDRQDVDGWTPLHAAVYWGQKEATQMLLDAGADIDIQNYSGQLASDNAPKDILVLLDKARKNQARRTKRRPPSLGNRITDGFENSTETPTKVIRVEMKPIDNNKEKEDELLPKPVPIISRPSPVPLTAQIVVPKPRLTESVARTTANATVLPGTVVPGTTPTAAATVGDGTASNPPPPTAPWRRQRAVPTPVPRHFYANEDETSAMLPGSSSDAVDYANLCFATSSSGINNTTATRKLSEKENQPTEPDVILRRTQSFENDEKFYQKYAELRARIQANSCTPHALLAPSTLISNTKTSTASTNNNNNNNNNINNNTTTTGSTSPASNISSYLVQRSASLKDHRTLRKTTSNLVLGSTATTAATTPASAVAPTTVTTTNTTTTVPSAGSTAGQTAVSNTTATVSPPTSPSGTPTTTPTAGQIRRSFVPPTRDEESETQRKAHAKRVRETRRSTQGVTLDEIKSAEQLVKKKNNPTGTEFKLEDASTPNVTASTTQSVISGSSHESTAATSGTGAEHGSITTKLTSTSALAQRRLQQQQQNGDSTTSSARPASTGVGSSSSTVASLAAAGEQYNRVPGSTAAGTEPVSTDASLLNLRRPPRSAAASGGSVAGEENKENDKENDSRTAQATQAVIQRRRRQKRRSTGVVPVGMEDLDPDRQDSPVDGEEKETGSERGRSRVGSTASELDTASQQEVSRENGGDFIDYKALYEQEKAEKEKLKASLRKKDEEVVTLKAALDRFTTATTKNNSLSELEKRERRAMERKMSEMEEELKQLEALKTENQRLKDENGALIRVISKLSR
uniref:Protein phosphatase 1 regulatory subunit 12a n=1 Tax=Anopheles triannulatus TaxID=58253 RepID=A0A2M4AAD6_9DIPT